MPFKALLTATFAVVAVGGTIVIGKHIIEEAPVNKLSVLKDPNNIKELLRKQGYNFLSTEGNADNEKWTELIKKYIDPKKSKGIKKIKDLKLKETTNEEDIKALKNKCNELLQKPITKGEEFNLSKQNAIDWCTAGNNNSHRIISVR